MIVCAYTREFGARSCRECGRCPRGWPTALVDACTACMLRWEIERLRIIDAQAEAAKGRAS